MLEKILQLSLNGLMAGAILAVPAIGLTMIYAVLRFVNFSVASHMAVGAFAGYMLNAWAGLPAWIAIFGAFLAAGAVGIASDHVALRPLRGYSALTLAIASIALNLMIESAIRFSFGGRPRDFAIPLRRDWSFGFLHVGPQQVENAVIAAVAMALLFTFLALTLTGKAMRAVADNPMLADSKGIDPDRMARLATGIRSGSIDQRAEQVGEARHRDAQCDGDFLRHQRAVVRDDILDDVERAGGGFDLARLGSWRFGHQAILPSAMSAPSRRAASFFQATAGSILP